MPRYELSLILRALERPETRNALRRVVGILMDRGALVQKLENLGMRRLPYKIANKQRTGPHTHGQYFTVEFQGVSKGNSLITKEVSSEDNVVRHNIVRIDNVMKIPKKTCPGPVKPGE